MDWLTPIDRSRSFFCDTLTPLYYTRAYDELDTAHRLRYNQLTGMLSNELILLLETTFVSAAVRAAEHDVDGDLRAEVARFAADERRHADLWRRLNRLSAPEWYRDRDRFLSRLPVGTQTLSRFVATQALSWPIIFWIQLSQEERSLEISRRLALMGDRLEPRYAAVYRAHLHDEMRHVRIDCELLERFFATRSATVRRLSATLLRTILGTLFLRPVRSTVRIVQVLAAEYPELSPLVPRIVAELATLVDDIEFQRMMYSRETTPLTFEWFDRFDEFRCMSSVLHAYEPNGVRVLA